MSKPTPDMEKLAREIWLEYQERRNDYRLTAVDLADYFEKAVALAITEGRLEATRVERERVIRFIRENCSHETPRPCRACEEIANRLITAIRQEEGKL